MKEEHTEILLGTCTVFIQYLANLTKMWTAMYNSVKARRHIADTTEH